MEVRVLNAEDEPAVLRFLEESPHTTLFLRSNLLAAGLVDHGQEQQGLYLAAVEGDRIVAIAAHYWNNGMVVQAPVHAATLASRLVEDSGRPVGAILGPHDQVVQIRTALDLNDRPTSVDSSELLMHVRLQELRVPPALTEGTVVCRATRDEDLDLLGQWATAYAVEALGAQAGPELEARSRERIESLHRRRSQWVLEADGELVSYTAFNASVPDCVQIGGVWTPPELRSRGYGRAVVAGSLADAQKRGVTDSVLFTAPENHAAQAAYRSLGYRQIGEYGMVLFS